MRAELAPGVVLWPGRLGSAEQGALLADVLRRIEGAPFYRPAMPGSGTPFSIEMTNFGPLGWVSDKAGGYRYQAHHPVTGARWPDIPDPLMELWSEVSSYPGSPEACLVNLYRAGARLGLHQDADEDAPDAPVLSVSLGDTAVYRFGSGKRRGPTRTVKLSSGDVLLLGGPARFVYHGVDRIQAGSSSLIPGGGRINLTLRRVTAHPRQQGTQSGG
jgi:alkylated DNA repair protein (DNA oxidative demethylase)